MPAQHMSGGMNPLAGMGMDMGMGSTGMGMGSGSTGMGINPAFTQREGQAINLHPSTSPSFGSDGPDWEEHPQIPQEQQ